MSKVKQKIEPMLATLTDQVPEGDYIYEVKWDGVRAIIIYGGGSASIRTRNQNDVTGKFPELQDPPFASSGIFDVEIICPDATGRPSFPRIIKRIRTSSQAKIDRLAQTHPVQCYVFDCLYLDEEPVTNLPLHRRRELLESVLTPDHRYHLSETFLDGQALLEAVKKQEMEGIVAKRSDSLYFPGKRSADWQKVKIRHCCDCKVIGYTNGGGDRSNTFGSLEVAEVTGEGLVYRGKVGTGFSDKLMQDITSLLRKLPETKKPSFAPTSKDTVWVQPIIGAEISYNEINPNGTYRAPVFEKLKLLD